MMETKAKVKISTRLSLPYQGNYRRGKRQTPGHCKLCGAPLSDPKSIKRGFGHKCLNKIPVLLVFEITPEEEE